MQLGRSSATDSRNRKSGGAIARDKNDAREGLALSEAGCCRTHLWSGPRFSHSDWFGPGPFLRSRSPRAKQRADDLVAGRPDRDRRTALSRLRARQRQLGAQCPRCRRSGARPRAAPSPLCRARASPGERPPVLKAISTATHARCNASFRCPRDRRWKPSAIWRSTTRSSRCARWTKPHKRSERCCGKVSSDNGEPRSAFNR